MIVPTRYLDLISGLAATEVGFGAGGIRLFTSDEVEAGQVGYSVDPNGSSLCGIANGEWKSSWLVIGSDTGVGDPIFLDTSDPNLAVLTAMHGESMWNPKPIAISIEAFGRIFVGFQRIAKGRTNPVESEDNPIAITEQDGFLSLVAENNEGRIGSEFWNDLFAYVRD